MVRSKDAFHWSCFHLSFAIRRLLRDVMNHKDLDVWKKSIKLVKKIYKITRSFPKDENFALVSQIKKSAISIPSNIAEGCARKSDKELIQFLYIALGSIAELETQLIISKELGFIVNDDVLDNLNEIRKQVFGLIKFLRSKDE